MHSITPDFDQLTFTRYQYSRLYKILEMAASNQINNINIPADQLYGQMQQPRQAYPQQFQPSQEHYYTYYQPDHSYPQAYPQQYQPNLEHYDTYYQTDHSYPLADLGGGPGGHGPPQTRKGGGQSIIWPPPKSS